MNIIEYYQSQNKPIKLNLGCFNKKIYDFINVDCRIEVNPDIVDDAFKLEKFEPDTISLIYTSHMMEHKDRTDGFNALVRYWELLKPGGKLYISVPDLEKVFEHYIFFRDLRKLQCFLYGSQNYTEDYHLNGWDFKTLKEDLSQIGFNKIKRFNRWKIKWLAGIDDYSAAYLEPEFDRYKGHLMSLNIKATK